MWKIESALKMNSGDSNSNITVLPGENTSEMSVRGRWKVDDGTTPLKHTIESDSQVKDSKKETNIFGPIGMSFSQYLEIEKKPNLIDSKVKTEAHPQTKGLYQLWKEKPQQRASNGLLITNQRETVSAFTNSNIHQFRATKQDQEETSGSDESEVKEVRFGHGFGYGPDSSEKKSDILSDQLNQQCKNSENNINEVRCTGFGKTNILGAQPINIIDGIHPTTLKIWFVDTTRDAENKHAQFLEIDSNVKWHCPFDVHHKIKKAKWYVKHVKNCYTHSLEGYNGKKAKQEAWSWNQCKYDPNHLVHSDCLLYHYYYNCPASKIVKPPLKNK